MIRRKKREKTAKTKCKFHGEELLGPQASLRVTPCPPAPNHTRGEVIRPPSQIKNNSYSVIRTSDLDDLSSTRCAPTTTARPSGYCIINKDKLSVWRVFEYWVGGRGGGWGSLSDWEWSGAFLVKNKGNESHKELTEAIETKNISKCFNGERLQRSYSLSSMCVWTM